MNNARYAPATIVFAVTLLIASQLTAGLGRWVCFGLAILFLGITIGWLRQTRGASPGLVSDEGDAKPTGFTTELLSAAVNEMREGMLVIDSEMRVVALNRAARSLFSGIEGQIDSRRLTEVTRNPAVYDAFLDGVRGTERSGVNVEIHGPTRRVFDLRVIPLKLSNGGNAAAGVFFDVTRLERLEVIRQEFLSNVSHELRTPLTAIVALSETLETGAIDDPENNRRFLSIIQKNAAHMHRLIDDILELSAIEAGTVEVRPETIRLSLLIEDVLGSLEKNAAASSVRLQNMVAPDAEIYVDPHRMTQMLTNLVENGIKFNRPGGEVSVRYSANDRDKITVKDTGEGIASHHLDRLFERFYRVDRARSRSLGGTGLGLAIVKHLARSHGGEVSVLSRLGEGTEFTIELPRRTIRAEADRGGVAIATN
jgi:two-component system, OmpR family, phosphate regulon sensor histidine kinase PhoR